MNELAMYSNLRLPGSEPSSANTCSPDSIPVDNVVPT